MALKLKKLRVSMQMSSNVKLEGFVFVEMATRLSDVLNHKNKDFIVLLDQEEVVHIVNKRHIVEVIELGEVL